MEAGHKSPGRFCMMGGLVGRVDLASISAIARLRFSAPFVVGLSLKRQDATPTRWFGRRHST